MPIRGGAHAPGTLVPRFCLVLAAPGYPGEAKTGQRICGLAKAARMPGARFFSAAVGTNTKGEPIVAGGRALNVVALGPTDELARQWACDAARKIHWPGIQMVEIASFD